MLELEAERRGFKSVGHLLDYKIDSILKAPLPDKDVDARALAIVENYKARKKK